MSDREITREDLKELERYADSLFKALGIDVSFTRHFLDRANDPRNKKQITIDELIRLYKEEYTKWGKKIASLGKDAEAVMKDMRTNINVPFVLNWNSKTQDLDLVAKTVMRKKDFKSPDRSFPVSEEAPVNAAGGGNVAGIGVGPKGEPGKSGPLLRRGKFAGHDTFIVNNDLFSKARLSKKSGMRWESYLGGCDASKEIRGYANSNPRKPIVLQHENSGAMMFARYGKKKR